MGTLVSREHTFVSTRKDLIERAETSGGPILFILLSLLKKIFVVHDVQIRRHSFIKISESEDFEALEPEI